MAQRMVERHFVFVGLTEHLPECFRLAEHLLPSYFKGATKIYDHIGRCDNSYGCLCKDIFHIQIWVIVHHQFALRFIWW